MTTSAVRTKRTPLEVSRLILKAAFKVHSHFGPGLLESVYESCLAQELRDIGLSVKTQVPVPVFFNQVQLEVGYRIDLLVDESVLVEVKSVEAMAPVHSAQTITYLKLAKLKLGLLINFNVLHLKSGIKRFVIGTDWK
jgi:GxxExxY protein